MFINVIVCWCVVAMGNWALQLFEVPCLVYSLPVFNCELSSFFCQQLSGEAATWLSNQQEYYLALCLVRKSPGHCILVTSVCGFPGFFMSLSMLCTVSLSPSLSSCLPVLLQWGLQMHVFSCQSSGQNGKAVSHDGTGRKRMNLGDQVQIRGFCRTRYLFPPQGHNLNRIVYSTEETAIIGKEYGSALVPYKHL